MLPPSVLLTYSEALAMVELRTEMALPAARSRLPLATWRPAADDPLRVIVPLPEVTLEGAGVIEVKFAPAIKLTFQSLPAVMVAGRVMLPPACSVRVDREAASEKFHV